MIGFRDSGQAKAELEDTSAGNCWLWCAIAQQEQAAAYEIANRVLGAWLFSPQQQLFLGDVMAARACRSLADSVTFNNSRCPDEFVRSLKAAASENRIPVALLSWLIFEQSPLLAESMFFS